ncbi:BZ3500_MvSof-1268-A1-R1_Chr1-3g02062 [Microbotryum saponariae]|uniref:Acyl-protein thioesterase 1 n=1 Tax=Microbotryum saponariae TaxID=289078 RepID=A0A2X0KU66_9BASI|nr:BZ3500_MvSof-1268-A1-R1_Chr1-3g02062 [Microbotryum saponariae]SCZ95296.1 BZ3501_MvSof-1269-A2-R1_Chr1-3g01664 [Microbotryum saponariae]
MTTFGGPSRITRGGPHIPVLPPSVQAGNVPTAMTSRLDLPRSDSPGPHDNTKPLLYTSPNSSSSSSPRCVVIYLHGRGGSPEEDLPVFRPTFDKLNEEMAGSVEGVFLRAQDEIWYPNHWDQPPISQEPYLTSALCLIDRTITSLSVPSNRVILAGFSQGASLALIYALSHPDKPLGGVLALSGSIIGAPEDFPGTEMDPLMPIYIGWGDEDRYYRPSRVEKDVEGLKARGGKVELRLFPGMGHFVTAAEVEKLEEMIRDVKGMIWQVC